MTTDSEASESNWHLFEIQDDGSLYYMGSEVGQEPPISDDEHVIQVKEENLKLFDPNSSESPPIRSDQAWDFLLSCQNVVVHTLDAIDTIIELTIQNGFHDGNQDEVRDAMLAAAGLATVRRFLNDTVENRYGG
jgi:hypothetical protein